MSNIDELLDTPEQSEEEVEETEEVNQDNLDDLTKEELAEALIKLDASKKQLYARATKAEAKLKEFKTPINKETKNTEPINLEEQIDLRFLKRDGLTDEQINDLKFIQAGKKAMGENITLMEAMNDPLYKDRQTVKELGEKRAKAQISSNGSSYSEEQKKVAQMTPEQHEAYAKDKADAILNRM